MNKLALAIATWFGCGYSPWAPGTVGSAGGVLVGWLLVRYAGWPPWTLAVLAAAATPVGIWAAGRTAELVGKKDPGLVVVDEVLGQWIALAALTAWSWPWALVAFALFRLFDIVKPWPETGAPAGRNGDRAGRPGRGRVRLGDAASFAVGGRMVQSEIGSRSQHCFACPLQKTADNAPSSRI
jgi:phosphatidylglycerophosphatase A